MIATCIAIRIATRVVLAGPPANGSTVELMSGRAALGGHQRQYWVWEHSASRHGARLVLLKIADGMRTETGWYWPSVKELCEQDPADGAGRAYRHQ